MIMSKGDNKIPLDIKNGLRPTAKKGIDTMKKMTKRDYFTILRNTYPQTADNYDEMIAFIDHEIELLARKNSSEKKPTATQKANETLKQDIYNSMEDNRLYTITEMIKEIPACKELSNQRVSAVVKQMTEGENACLEKVVEKRRSYFRKMVEG